ncbi:MAG: SDR family oxidoreductase [Gammaproteobacteria bacterium]
MNILIIGANSAIARACARLYAEQGHKLYLVARDRERLQELEQDLAIRGAVSVFTTESDLEKSDEHENIMRRVFSEFEILDLVLIAYGTLPDQESCATDFEQAELAIRINGTSVISLLTRLAERMTRQQCGTIAVITSVAADRGRQPNYVYGSAKALVSTYLQGLRGRLFRHNVHVVEIKPGLVDSPMTAHLKKGLLFSSPEKVARTTVSAIARRKHTVYVPIYWRCILWVVRALPDTLFKRIKF